MRRIVLAILGAIVFYFIAPTSFSQTNPNMANWHSKYWFYRWRLRNDFMVMGSGPGQSLIAESRNTERYPIIKWADAMIMHGYYLTMLAIEHKILESTGRYADLKNNERELYYAIKAFERVDYVTETFYSSEGNDQDAFRTGDTPLRPDVNGYFFRDDVPPDFVNLTPYPAGNPPTYSYNYYQLTNEKTGIEYRDFLYSKSDYEGLWNNVGYLQPPNIEDPKKPIVDFTKIENNNPVYGLGEESQDQIIRLLLGFETIIKSIENISYGIDTDKDGIDDAVMNFHEEAKRHSTNMIGRMAGHFSGTKTVDVDNNMFWGYPSLGYPTSPYWTILNPRNNQVSLGGAVWGYMPPIQMIAGSLFTQNNDIGINSPNYAMGAYNPYFTSTWNLGIGGYNNNANAKMALILNVISNSGGAFTANGVARHIYNKSQEKHFQGLYIPLYDYFWNWDPNQSADQDRKEEAYNYANLLLSMAPCVGPHNFGYTNIGVAGGNSLGVFSPHQDPDGIPIYWNVPFLFDNSHDTWDDGKRQDENGNDAVDEGWFAGVDYMLLYNLIYANNEEEQPLYHDLINRVVDYDIDTDLNSSMVGYSAEGLLIGAFEDMKVTGNIYGNTPVTLKALDYVELDYGIYDPNNTTGSITIETGKISCGTDFTSQNTPYSIDQCTACSMENQVGSFIAPKSRGRIMSNSLSILTPDELEKENQTNGSVIRNGSGDIAVFPNPTKDFFTISETEGLQQIILMDQNGSEIKQFDILNKLQDISDLSAGVYMLILKFNENETKHIKLVKL